MVLIESRVNRSIIILVIEADPESQFVIDDSLRVSIPQAEPVFIASAEEAQLYLYKCSTSQLACPKLVLLSMEPSRRESDWQLLKELRTHYPLLPVLILSSYSESGFIKQSYEFGAHSFLTKPQNQAGWELQFELLATYWFGIVTLPPTYPVLTT